MTPINMILPDEARIALAWARRFHSDAFVAGGYLRDIFFAHKPKDLDIFTFSPDIRDGGESLLDAQIDGPTPHEWVDVYENDRLLDAEKPVTIDGVSVPVQIVHLNADVADTAEMATSQFMIGLSQLWFDGLTVRGTDAFFVDRRNRTMTVRYCTSPRSMERIFRKVSQLRTKYPAFDVVVPGEFIQHLYSEAA